MIDTPRSLLVRLAENATEADWRRLLDVYQPFIIGWLRRTQVPEQDVVDLSQDVFAAVLSAIGSFRHAERIGSFRAWLRMIVVNRTRNYWRGSKNTVEMSATLLEQLEDPASGLSGEWNRDHDAHVARKLLAMIEGEFAPLTWSAFRRHVLEGQRAAAVAAELGTTVNVVLLAKSRVLRRLREEAGGLVDEI